MTEAHPDTMIRLLRGPALRCRTGILLVEPAQLAHAPEIAARLGIDCVDYSREILACLPPETCFVDITAETEEARLHQIAEARVGTDCILVYNLDLALARLDTLDRDRLWANLRDRFPHRHRALVVAMPAGADGLLPGSGELSAWRESGRLSVFPMAE